MDLNQWIRDIPDFPKPGIVFKDITPLLKDPAAFNHAFRLLVGKTEHLRGSIDTVVGIESRGFLFGPMLARELKAGLVPVRKPGKLPFQTRSIEYGLEYGRSSLELHIDAISPGERVLIHDDVLATGGTAEAACRLIEEVGGVVVQFNFLVELTYLGGSERLSPRAEVQSLLHY